MSIEQPGVGVNVAIFQNGCVLMGMRTKNDGPDHVSGEGLWTFPGGKAEKWQTLEENALREVREESGLILDRTRLHCVSINDHMNPARDAHFIVIGFSYYTYKGENIVPRVTEPSEISEWVWCNLKKLPSPESVFHPTEHIIQELGLRN